jgi:hypothetical protein
MPATARHTAEKNFILKVEMWSEAKLIELEVGSKVA